MRWILRCLLLTHGVAIAAPLAHAHTTLIQSTPAAESVLATPPQAIRLRFNSSIAANLSGIALTTAEGSSIIVGPASAAPGIKTDLVAPIYESLPPGTYRVRWHIVSADMHKLEGEFAFEVRP